MIIDKLPIEAVKFMEKHGIESDSISHKSGDVYIEIDDIEIAFDFRELMLDLTSCCLISHPFSNKPTLLIHNILK
jgi:hypothetical protein